MPQMAPLSWLTLMIIFIMMLVLFNIKNYYSFQYNLKTQESKSNKKNIINWKW